MNSILNSYNKEEGLRYHLDEWIKNKENNIEKIKDLLCIAMFNSEEELEQFAKNEYERIYKIGKEKLDEIVEHNKVREVSK